MRFRTMTTTSEAVDHSQLSADARAERSALYTAQALINAHVGRDKRIGNERLFAEAIAAALLSSRIAESLNK